MNKIRDVTIKKIHEERAETQSRIKKAREQEISVTVKNPHKIEFEETGNDKKSPPNGKETVYNENSIFSEEMNKWQCQ